MKLSFMEIILLVTGFGAAVVTFIHRLRMTVLQKMSKHTYQYGHFAISFLVAGLMETLFCIALDNGVLPFPENGELVRILMCVSGGTLLIGIWNMIRYYRSV